MAMWFFITYKYNILLCLLILHKINLPNNIGCVGLKLEACQATDQLKNTQIAAHIASVSNILFYE